MARKFTPLPSREEILEQFDYDAVNGTLTRKGSTHPYGSRGYKENHRYVRVLMNGKKLRVHRLIYTIEHGSIPEGMLIDHINRVTYDNRISNLRVVTEAENCLNRGKPDYGTRK